MAQQVYRIGNMDCANCAQEIETGVSRLDGVQFVRVDFSTGRMSLQGDVAYEALQARVESLGKTLHDADATLPSDQSRGGVLGFWDYLQLRHETRLALVGAALILLTMMLSLLMFGFVAGLGAEAPATAGGLLINGLYTVAMLIALQPIARSGINALRINREFNINLLMSIAAIGAILIQEYLEAALVIFLFSVGEALEGYTADRARDSLRGLLALKPKEALLLRDGQQISVGVESLRIGDSILVKPGERLPMDGEIVKGSSGLDQAPITGESIPVFKGPGDSVFAGSINGTGSLEIRVTQHVADNTLSRIIRMVEEAQSERAPSQRMIDQFAHYYTPAVVLLAALVALVPPLFFNAPFYSTATEQGWLYRALTMLVIACPCALVISTPVTVISAIAAAARHGVLIKGGVHLENLGRVKAIAFDKTGTLTEGRPSVTQTRSTDCLTDDDCSACDDLLALASALEQQSSHPLAQAVINAADARSLSSTYAAHDVHALAGQGLQGRIGERLISLGSHSYFDQQYPHQADFCTQVSAAEEAGQTTMLLHDGERVRGFIAVADTIRADSAASVAALNAMGLETVMLTGDNATVAQAVGAAVGVRDVRAGLLPQDKQAAVQALMQQHGAVLMLGDGINDTPALASATVGMAMGGAGSAQALETADVALMGDDLARLPFVIQLARMARHIIRQNVILSFSLKAAFLLLAAMGGASLWAAVFADVGMSLLVTLNGMRPLRLKPTDKAAAP